MPSRMRQRYSPHLAKFLQRAHHRKAKSGGAEHIMQVLASHDKLSIFAGVPGCFLQKAEGNPGRQHHNKKCVEMKVRLANFCLPPGTKFTTSNMDDILVLVTDSGGCLSAQAKGTSEKMQAEVNAS